jgi:indolepyruvate ferredoxin oxidoreductase beta subunit
MKRNFPTDRERITIAILALGGEGGGVLADWILELASANGYVAQGTSVPGVAQRTGSTVYYIEMVKRAASVGQSNPVLAMMPVPGDVDIVVASELMEAGRAILRGFVTEDRTTLIGSTHRVYAISEKSVPGDGTGASQRILDAAARRSARFIGFDMAAAAGQSGSVISSVMFGALAGSEVLPFSREAFEGAIRHGGKAIETNLKGFGLGFSRAQEGDPTPAAATTVSAPAAEPTSAAGRRLKSRVESHLPEPAWPLAVEGVRRLIDYQDARYADLYLDRLEALASYDDLASGARLSSETARYLALWMSYEDTIRVADLKVRATRSARVAKEVRLAPGQVMAVTEYMHPRLREVCETLPSGIGSYVWNNKTMRRWLEPLFSKGRHVETTSLRWFVVLRFLASLRATRRGTLRYREEQHRIEQWLAFAAEAAAVDRAFATEIILCQQVIKGYSDTFERGLERFATLMGLARSIVARKDAAELLRTLRDAALADEQGDTLDRAIGELRLAIAV